MPKEIKIDNNVCCPFCKHKIKGKIPEGLNIKRIIEFVKKEIKIEKNEKNHN